MVWEDIMNEGKFIHIPVRECGFPYGFTCDISLDDRGCVRISFIKDFNNSNKYAIFHNHDLEKIKFELQLGLENGIISNFDNVVEYVMSITNKMVDRSIKYKNNIKEDK